MAKPPTSPNRHSENQKQHFPGFRNDIQILRAIAVIWVVAYHLQIPGFENGLLGVDIFFVISGFLMGKTYQDQSGFHFIGKRIKRLVPAYIVMILTVLFIGGFKLNFTDFSQLYKQALFATFFLNNFGFWLQTSYFDYEAFNPLMNLWSLSIEMQYYLLLPILLTLTRGKIWILYCIFACSLFSALVVTSISPKTSFFLLPFRIWEFLFGYFAWKYGKHSGEYQGHFGGIVSICLLTIALALPMAAQSTNILSGHVGIFAIYVTLISAWILYKPIYLLMETQNLILRVFVFLGERSYSLYLVHFPTIVFFNYSPFEGTKLGFNTLADLMSILLITSFFTWILFEFVEPLRYRKFDARILFLIFFLFFGTATASKAINENKYSHSELKIFSAWFDRDSYRCGKIFRILNPTSSICTFNPNMEKPGIFLIGNSHADAIKSTLVKTLKDFDEKVHFHVSNNPLMAESIQPEDIVKEAINREVSGVLFHYSSSFFDKKEQVDALTLTVNKLKSHKINTFILSPIPGYEFHVPKLLYKSLQNENDELLGMTLSKYYDENTAFFSMFENEAFKGVTLLKAENILCPKGQCLIQKDGYPLYFDAGHLTQTGSELLRPIFNLNKK